LIFKKPFYDCLKMALDLIRTLYEYFIGAYLLKGLGLFMLSFTSLKTTGLKLILTSS